MSQLAQVIPYDSVRGFTNATLPKRYDAAKKALEQCGRLDECKEWKDKAEALRSYARQAQDDDLYQMALKIQNRARRRIGQLLRQVEKRQGVRTDLGPPTVPSRKSAASDAGISKRQAKEAKAISRVPKPKFEEMTEAGATATEIANEGRNYDDAGSERERFSKCTRCGGRFPLSDDHNCAPVGFAESTKVIGALLRLSDFLSDQNPVTLARAMSEEQLNRAYGNAESIRFWLGKFITSRSSPRRKK